MYPLDIKCGSQSEWRHLTPLYLILGFEVNSLASYCLPKGGKKDPKIVKMSTCRTQAERIISALYFWVNYPFRLANIMLLDVGDGRSAPLTKITLMLLPWRDLRRFVTPFSKPPPMKIPLLKWYRRMVLRASMSPKKNAHIKYIPRVKEMLMRDENTYSLASLNQSLSSQQKPYHLGQTGWNPPPVSAGRSSQQLPLGTKRSCNADNKL